MLGIDTPAKLEAAKEAEGRAIGGACRHSGRALEDCYTLNPKASKAAIYQGWREMDAYMRENNIEVVPALLPKPEPTKRKKPAEGDGAAGQDGATGGGDEKKPATLEPPPLPLPPRST